MVRARYTIKEFTGEYEICGGSRSRKLGKELGLSKTSCLLTGNRKVLKDMGLSDCGCDTGFHAGIVLDPFVGAGTTAITARALNRHFLGIDLNPDYVAMSKAHLGVPITTWTTNAV